MVENLPTETATPPTPVVLTDLPDVKDDQEGQSWLTITQYTKKYNISARTSRPWIRKGWLSAKLDNTLKNNPRYVILDLPPAQHPGYAHMTGRKGPHRPNQQRQIRNLNARGDLDGVKRRMKEIYLPNFIARAPHGQMTFTTQELIEYTGASSSTVYQTWVKYGLKSITPPADKNADKNTRGLEHFTPTKVYLLSEIHRFLSGQWEEKGFKSNDDKVVELLGGSTTESGFYQYDDRRAYPHDGPGVLAWIKDSKIVRENKRTNKWEEIILWDKQIEYIMEAMKRVTTPRGEEYKYRLILCSAPRGEGKTLLNALITMFRFFNLFGEVINLSGNSKDQVTFAHYDLIKKTILNTYLLNNTPGLVVKEKYIALLRKVGDPVCQIKAVPTSSGLLPGTTCAVFTELHQLEDRGFFIDLWTSTRSVPNAQVLVDTTVAPRGHIVHTIWETFSKGDDPNLYFFHYADKHYNPETTPEQLNSFKKHMLESEYNKYFRNRWGDATGGVFMPVDIRKIGFAGIRRVNADIPTDTGASTQYLH